MNSVWEELGDIVPDLVSPCDVVAEIFQPIKKYTGDKVNFKLQKVNYFPEEVAYTSISPAVISIMNSESFFDAPKKLPHPEFGYNPESSKAKESFRYRLLIFLNENKEFELELFKFKFPLNFYPVHFYIHKDDFPELQDKIGDGIDVFNETDLKKLINLIIKSDSTLTLIKRIMALNT